jgi:hypothetical protein
MESTRFRGLAPPPAPPHNVAGRSGLVKAVSVAATLRGGGRCTRHLDFDILVRVG